jgi:hypothetical protein
MKDEIDDITDPLGNQINLPVNLFNHPVEDVADQLYNEAVSALKKPALVIESVTNNEREIHYFRSIDWNITMLVSVRLTDNRWVVHSYIQNPASELLAGYLRNGKRLF